jgi:hypothetical protein
MKIDFRIAKSLLEHIRADLRRPHEFALERVGFIYCRFGTLRRNDLLALAYQYIPVNDEHYVESHAFGAEIGSDAFRSVLQYLLENQVGVFHVHLHEHCGLPSPSGPDRRETEKFVPDFFHGRPDMPHGAIILSSDKLSGRVWLGETAKPKAITGMRIVGAPFNSFEDVP